MLRSVVLGAVLIGIFVLGVMFGAGSAPADPPGMGYVPGQVIIKFKSAASPSDKDKILRDLGGDRIKGLGQTQAELRGLRSSLNVDEAVARYRNHPKIQYIEPNFLLQADRVPNDPRFAELWGMRNIGQTGGTPGADIHAPTAWDHFLGSSQVLIGVIDTGVDYTHPDLAANIWTNPGEVSGNGIDDDHNGYVDDVRGWDFVNGDNNPLDDNGHGTHVSGTIGAVGDNGTGVVGVNWHVKIMPLKFLSSGGSGSTANAILAVQYATMMHVNLTSNSWGGGGFSQGLMDAIADAGTHGILFVAAAGNSGVNTDGSPHYPSSYPLDNIVSVAATDHNDQLAGFSNYGVQTVDLAAPGVNILSTFPNATYGAISGTSMATPHVSGVLGLVFGRFPEINHLDAKALVLNSADRLPSLNGRVMTGGRLNAWLPISEPDSIPPAPVVNLTVSESGSNWLRVSWTASGDDGGTGTASRYEVKISTTPLSEANFNAASSAGGPSDPAPPGAPESMQIKGLQFSTLYYIALKTVDDYGNASLISNVVSATTLGAPNADILPTSLTQTLVVGSTADPVLTLSNVGQGTLDFEIPTPTLAIANVPLAEFTDIPKGAVDTRVGQPVTLGSGGPDGFGYRWTDSDQSGGPTFDWVDISGTGTQVLSQVDDQNVGPFNIGFPFKFYGAEYTSFRVSSNGILSFTSSSSSYSNQPLPSPNAPLNMVAPFWDDLYVSPGKVYYRSEPSRLIVQWNNISHFGSGGPYTFELILTPGGSIKFQYLSMGQPTNEATIGIQNATGDDGLQVAFNTPYVHNNLAVQIQSVPQWLNVTPSAGTVLAPQSANLDVHLDPAGLLGGTYQASIHVLSNDPTDPDLTIPVTLTVIGAPDIAASPNGLDFGQVILGTAPTASIRIDNLGTDPLHVGSLSVNDPVFHTDVSSAVIPPREFKIVTVTFTPVAVHASPAMITIVSDDPDTPTLTLPLSGEGIPAPVIGVAPQSLSESLFTGNASEQTLTVTNTGGSNLNLNVEVESTTQGMTPEQAVSAIIARSGIQNGPIPITGTRLSRGGYTAQTLTRPDEVASVSHSNHPLSGVDVVLVSAEDPSFSADVQANLIATGRFSSVTQIDARIVTPTLAELQAFDAVMVWSDYPYLDADQLGNNLADFVDGGGGVVSAVFEVALEQGASDYNLRGRWASESYFVLTRSNYQSGGPFTLGAVLEPGHPTMQGVSSFNGGSYSFRPTNPSLTSGATLVARWSDSAPLVAVKNIGTAKRVDLGFFPVSSAMDPGLWQANTDGALLMANALEWTAGPTWLSVDPTQGTIAPGGSLAIHTQFDAEGLDGGPYDAAVAITSNDPHTSLVRIPVHLDVTGAPDLAVSPGALDFGIQLIGDTKTLNLRVKNEGTAQLHVTSIDLSHTDYTATPNAFTLAPRETLAVQVRYAPTSTGPRPGTLTFHSDDPDAPALLVALSGEGIPAPVIGVAPNSLSDALLTGDTSEQTLVVTNTGGSNLNLTLARQNAASAGMTPEQVVTALIQRSGILSGPISITGVSLTGEGSAQAQTLTGPEELASVGYSDHPLSGLAIALVSADDAAFDVDVQAKLLATGRFSSVTRIDARVVTPTLAELEAFDAVMVFSNFTYSDPILLGNNLADYVDGGGGVVSALFEVANSAGDSNYSLKGRWASQSYFVLTRTARQIGPAATLGVVLEPGHPTMQGVSSFHGGSSSYRPINPSLTPGATLVARWSDGVPLVAVKNIGISKRVDLGFFPPSNGARSDFWQANTDGALLMANALEWTAGPSWLSVDPTEGTIAPGGNLTIHAGFDAEGLDGGPYDAAIAITSNDPLSRLVRIPVHLDVTGAPDVAVSPGALDFGVQLIGDTKTLDLSVKNEGSEQLHVTGIDLSHPDYTATPNTFMLAPHASLAVQVHYAPTSTGPRPGTLTLHSDDPDTPALTVVLSGEGIPAPDIVVAPSSLNESLFTGDTSSQLLNIANTGGSNLYIELDTDDADALLVPAYSPPRASAEGNSSTGDSTPIQPGTAAGDPRILVIQETSAWGVFMNTVLDANFHLPCTVIPASAIASTNFSTYDLIITVGDESSTYYSALSANVAKFEAFVSAGGVVQYQLATQGSNVQIPGGVLVEFGDLESQNRVLLPNHPIVQGLPPLLLGNSANHCTIQNLPAGALVVTDSNIQHRPTTVEYRVGHGHVIATGMTWEYLYYNNYNSGPMLLKALTYSLSLIGPSWLSLDTDDATVPPGQNRNVQVSFNAAGLNGGTYRAQIAIQSNDPDERLLSVPVELHVTGAGRIQLTPTALDFGSLFIGRVHDLPLTVSNVGTDVLNVSSMIPSRDDYMVFESSLSLSPGDSHLLLVRFQPLAAGDRSGTLTFVSNDPHSPTALPLSGTGVIPPVAVATPASIEGTAMPGGTKTKTLRLCNTGGSNLEYAISALSPPAPPPDGPRLALHVRSHTSKSVQTCRAAEDGGSAPTNLPCSSYVTQAPTGVGQDIYVVVAGANAVGVTGLTCGITYNGLTGQGVDVYNWTFCGDGLQFPSDTWPSSGGGNRMTWLTCQNRELPPDGVHAIAGSFYVYAYSADSFRATENRTVGVPELKYATCTNVEVDIPVTAAGAVRFSTGATLPGFNPCIGGVLVYDGLEVAKGAEDRRIGTPVVERRGGPDHYGHRWIDSDEPGGPVFNWTDIRSVGTLISISGDEQNSGPLPIGFSFPFYDNTFPSFTVCTNGWISFTSTVTSFSNQPLPSLLSPENLIAPFWDDLYMSTRKAYYYNDGSRLIVQFQDVSRAQGDGPFTFQVILSPDGTIVYQYLSMLGVVTTATVGIQNATRDDGLNVAFNTPFLHDNLAVSITTAPSWLSVQPPNGVLSPAQCIDVQVIMNAMNLVPNQYQAMLNILSNDPINPTIARDVLFRVGTTNAALADVDPNTLNAGAPGRWVTAYVELPAGLNPADIVLETVRALGTVPADISVDVVGDFNLNGVPDRTLKFDRGTFLQALPDDDSVHVVITGEVRDMTTFVAQDDIRILRPHLRTVNAGGSFMAGTAVEIRWDIPPAWHPDHSDLFYSPDNGATWTLIASGVHGQSYVWRFPNTLTDAGRVAVYAYDATALMGIDRSDQAFKVVNSVTGVAEEAPPAYGLLQNVPNPFSGSTTIHFSLLTDERVVISVFDLNGRRVRELVNSTLPSGQHQAIWDGRSSAGVRVASGLYLYRMETKGYTLGKRMYLLH